MQDNIKKELFAGVYGYDSIKKELSMIRDWFLNKEALNEKVMLPKGILFYGVAGCGKTLILREYAESFNSKVIIVDGKSDNISEEICNAFKEARKESFVVVIIDEIDMLIGDDSQVGRTIQSEMDGINTNGSILVLATTNSIKKLNRALLRSGRFDRRIEISLPDKASRRILIEKFIKELDGNDEYVNYEQVSLLGLCTCSDLKAVINDAYLRQNGKFTTEGIEESFQRILFGSYEDNSSNFKDMRVAIHEAGHAIVASLCKNYNYYCAKFNEGGGITELSELDEHVDTIEKREENIRISMAGYLAEKVLLGKKDVGSYSDYDKAFDACTRLVERVCVNDIGDIIPPYMDNTNRFESENKRYRNEKQVIKLLHKYEKETRKLIKKNKQLIQEFANTMYQKGKVYAKDFVYSKDRNICYDVAKYCIENNIASINSIQSHFGIGFKRAYDIVLILERKGIIRKEADNRRVVLITLDELDAKLS